MSMLLAAGCGSNSKSGVDAARDAGGGKDTLASVGLDAGVGPETSTMVDGGTAASPDIAMVDSAAAPDAASGDTSTVDAGGATPDSTPGQATDAGHGADTVSAVDAGADLSQPDAAVSPDTAAAVDATPDATTTSAGKIGVVVLTQTVETLPVVGTFVASGGVAQFGFKAGGSSCTPTTQGACQLYACTASSDNTVDKLTLVQAGTVTITGLGADLALRYMAAQTAYMSSSQGYLWTSSKAATVTVSGSADVPAFSLNLTVPNPITVTSPVAQIGSTGASYTLSRSGDLVVTWTGGVDGNVTVSLSSKTGPSGEADIACTVAASAGTVTVPGAFMSQLGTTGGFAAGVTSYATKDVGDWLMLFEGTSSSATGTATFTN